MKIKFKQFKNIYKLNDWFEENSHLVKTINLQYEEKTKSHYVYYKEKEIYDEPPKPPPPPPPPPPPLVPMY